MNTRLQITFHPDGTHTHNYGPHLVTHKRECNESARVRALVHDVRDVVRDAIGNHSLFDRVFPVLPKPTRFFMNDSSSFFSEAPLPAYRMGRQISIIPKEEKQGSRIGKIVFLSALTLLGVGAGCYFSDAIRRTGSDLIENLRANMSLLQSSYCNLEATDVTDRSLFCRLIISAHAE